MVNRITEKYFTQGDFSQREIEVVKEIVQETGFELEEEIFRGVIYEKNKVGSLIYKGKYKEKPAVLKIQGLKPEIDEAKMVRNFIRQNRSLIVRVPELYSYKEWNKDRGYGFLIGEHIGGRKIFKMPFATEDQMRDYGKFYQEYRSLTLNRPWIEQEAENSLKYTLGRIDNWRKISEHKGRLKEEDYVPFLERFKTLANRYFPSIPLMFCHRHLSANDVYKMPDGSYVLLSNLFWSYCLQWYELAFNFWACMQHIRNIDYRLDNLLEYLESWRKHYKQIPVVREDKEFDRKLDINLLERTMGAILVDIGVNDFYDKPENQKYFKHLLKLHQEFFNHLVKKLRGGP